MCSLPAVRMDHRTYLATGDGEGGARETVPLSTALPPSFSCLRPSAGALAHRFPVPGVPFRLGSGHSCPFNFAPRNISHLPFPDAALMQHTCRVRLGLEGSLTPLEATRLGSVVAGAAYFNPFAPQGHYNLDMAMPGDREVFRAILSLDKVGGPTSHQPQVRL